MAKRGRPAHLVSDKSRGLVKTLVAAGLTQPEIADCLEISESTLRRSYKRELRIGRTLANASVVRELYNRCMHGDTKAIIFWLTCRAPGWKPSRVNEHQGPDGGPIEVQTTARVLLGLSDEEIERVLAERERDANRAAR